MKDLYPHNQKAVDAVKFHFADGNSKAAVVHATGTGKSYIIAAVAEDYGRVLVIAPNHFVLDETRKVCHADCEFRTYASVMYDEGEIGRYDLIVLDEFHRGGAERWGEGVQRVIEANPQALLLGTSATHVRYLDNQRNMADELFDGQVVSHLPLKEALDQGILPNPTYVSSIYSMEDTVRSRKQKIHKCRKKGIDKEELCRRLDGIAHNWENAGGVPQIIRKYFTHDMQRVIVFCSKVKRAAEARQMLSKWFGLAGFQRVRYYNIDYKEKRLEKEMEDFQQPLGDYDLKVAISVNMLNEGVHIPHVDGVIMLRSTISRIIIEQQVGRCLTSNNSDITPVVLDLVNNMDLIRYDDLPGFGEWTGERSDNNSSASNSGFPFKVIDECRDLRVLLAQLDEEITHENVFAFEERYNQIIQFIHTHGELPSTINGGEALYVYAGKFRYNPYRSNYPECVRRLAELGFDMSTQTDRYDEKLARCIAFRDEYGRIPMVTVSADKEEKSLGMFLKAHWSCDNKRTDEQRLRLIQLGLYSDMSTEVWKFAEQQKRRGALPSDKEYGRKPLSVKVDEVIAYYKEHGDLPAIKSADGMRTVVHDCIAWEVPDVVRLYKAGVFDRAVAVTPRVRTVLAKHGIDVKVDATPLERMEALIAKYGSFATALDHAGENIREDVKAVYRSATDDECVDIYHKGWYTLRYVEVRNRLKALAKQGRINIKVSRIKKETVDRRMHTDKELVAYCKKLGRLPNCNCPAEQPYYCSIRNRWKDGPNIDVKYLQKLIDKGLYQRYSKHFRKMVDKYGLTLPHENETNTNPTLAL